MSKKPKAIKDYLVTWAVDIAADSPEEAARKALEIQRDPDSIANVFDVNANGFPIRVDFAAGDPPSITTPPITVTVFGFYEDTETGWAQSGTGRTVAEAVADALRQSAHSELIIVDAVLGTHTSVLKKSAVCAAKDWPGITACERCGNILPKEKTGTCDTCMAETAPAVNKKEK